MLSTGLLAIPTAYAQTSGSAYTTGYRWDSMRRLVGEISPDPDGAGPLTYAAIRYTYDALGRLTKTERGKLSAWQSEAVLPSAWTGYTVLETVDVSYDAVGNKVKETLTASGAVQTVTQMSYDANDRLDCTAVRMNASVFGSLPASACTLGTQGTFGPDRVTKNVYDAAGQLLQVQKAYGTALQQNYATYTYSLNGKQTSITDANGNKAAFVYDGFDRQTQWFFPSKTTAGQVSATDYEQYAYDSNGNRTQVRKRDGQIINYSYDALNRVTVKDFANNATALASDVYYAYDLLGHQLEARFDSSSGQGIINTYDNVGRFVTSASFGQTLSYQYDANGNRTRLTFPDALYVQYDYDGLNRMNAIRENGAASGVGVLASYVYDDLGRRTSVTRGNGTTTSYGYDAASRLSSLAHDLDGAATTNDLSLSFTYNPASQMATRTASNDAYAFVNHYNVNRAYTGNGLNQYTASGALSLSYDANGNLTSDSAVSFAYDAENRWVSASGAKTAALSYDPMGRLRQTVGSLTTQFLYDGDALVAEYDGAGALLRRYVHGSGVDEPVAWYEGASTADRRFLHANHQGSIVAVTNASGTTLGLNAYDAYGIANANDLGRFQYTGQITIPEVGVYHYKARAYSPTLGRFLQADPIGYGDQINLYAYVANDPVNKGDPTGESGCADLPEQNPSLALAIAAGHGGCYEASNFNPKKDGNETTITTQPVLESAQENMSRLEVKEQENVAAEFLVDSSGNVTFHILPAQSSENGVAAKGTFKYDLDAVALGHPHPNNTTTVSPGFDRYSRAGDYTSVERGKPMYIVNNGNIGVLEKSGGQYRFILIKGSITFDVRKEIQSSLRVLQTRSRQ